MKKFYTLLLTLSISIVSATAATKVVKHKIKSGETLYTVAHKHKTTIEEVRKLNGIKKGEILKIGKVVKVPTNTYHPKKKKRTAKKSKTSLKYKIVKHKIKSGETLYTVAHKHKTTIEEVRKLNGIKKGEILKIGRVVKVSINTNNKKPIKSKVLLSKNVSKKSTYIIKSGDTLSVIAGKHKMKLSELIKMNNIRTNAPLKIGKKLIVAKHITKRKKQKIVKTKKHKKIKIVKKTKNKKKANRILRSVLNRHAKPLAKKRVKKRRIVTVDDILFKSSQPNVMVFRGFSSKKSRNIIKLAKRKLGKRYVWGAVGQKNTFDCSGLTKYVFKQNGINLPRTSINQSKYGKPVNRSQLKPGDLVFFDTSKRRKGYVNHVGIYLGNGKFIHASSAKKKVVVSNLSKFYSQRYKGARRPS